LILTVVAYLNVLYRHSSEVKEENHETPHSGGGTDDAGIPEYKSGRRISAEPS